MATLVMSGRRRELAGGEECAELVAQLGGRRQMRVTGTINGAAFAGSTMLVAMAPSVSG